MGQVVLEGVSTSKLLPNTEVTVELQGKEQHTTGKGAKKASSMSRGMIEPASGKGTMTLCYKPKPPTPVSKRREHRGKTRSSVPLEAHSDAKLLHTRRLDFSFCGANSPSI
jgi:hypothetical protein